MVTEIKFKSTPENWFKEYIGLKNNTLRKFDDNNDQRKVLLDEFIAQPYQLWIEIRSTADSDNRFMRAVTDVTFWEGYYIISWEK